MTNRAPSTGSADLVGRPTGLRADLQYAYPRPNRLQLLVRYIATTRWGARWAPSTLVPLDRLTTRLTHGRVSLPRALAGLPVLDLVTVGRRSGLRRSTRVIAIPFHDTLALLGTNFGQATTPAWALNLEQHPQATVSHDGTTCAVVAREATRDEVTAISRAAEAVFGGVTAYERRLEGVRRVRVFVLETPR